jgi:lysophospholipase L1-like esterase
VKARTFIVVLAGIALLGACSGSSDEATNGAALQPSAGSGGTIAAGGTGTAGSRSPGAGGSISTGEGGTGASLPIDPGVGGSLGGVVAADASVGVPDAGNPVAEHWVGTWTASPYPVATADQPPASLANAVLRQVARVSLGGTQIRVQFSNRSGNGPVSLRSAHVAICRATPLVDSSIDTATDTALRFAGAESVTLGQGLEVWSDPIEFALPALGALSITTAFESVPGALTGHAGSRTTSYVQAGSSDVSAADLASAARADHWYYISGIEVMAAASARAIVAIGDSITDGRGTTTNGNNRWTDIVAARLQANAATANVAMLNQGIGATNLVGSTGTAAEARFSRDVLGQSGVRYAIVYDGVNDIGGGASFESMRDAYSRLISAAHGAGLLVYGGTILPFGGNGYYTPEHENVRQQVNAFIKSGAFDGYIDFDAALTDGGNPPRLQTPYATWAQTDGLHPGPAGYQRMGDTPDLTLFTR